MATEKRLFLLDAMALIYRAYYALNKNPRINSKGMNTSAILGFANTLYEVLKNEKPTHIGVAFDTMAPTFRHEDFLEYKANRQAPPEDITNSLPYIKELIKAFNIPILYVDGYEADDVIGTLAKNAEAQGYKTYMMTSDKDFGQLVSGNILMYKPPRRGNTPEILGEKEICEKFGIQRTEQVRDLLGLWGDSSDNIPGIPGVGQVTAKKLVAEFDTVENLIQNSGQIKNNRIKEKVKEYGAQAIQCKQLATIITDVPIDFSEEDLTRGEPNIPKLKEILNELEFKAFAKRVFDDLNYQQPGQGVQGDLFAQEDDTQAKTINSIDNSNYFLVNSNEEVEKLVAKLKNTKDFCFDTETTSLSIIDAELVGIAFATKAKEAYFLLLPEKREEALQILEKIKPVFEDSTNKKIGQNLKYDISVLKNYGIDTKGELFDTMIAHYLLHPDLRHNMDFLAETYLDYKPISIETLIGKKGKKQGNIRSVPTATLKDYACEDADITYRLKDIFEPQLEENELLQLFKKIEIPLIEVLSTMERNGVKIDTKALENISEKLAKEIDAIEKDIYQMGGKAFNIGSPKQLGDILFDELKIVDKPKLTRTKQYSTSEDVLQKLRDKHPIIEKVLEYRSLTKLKSTYVDALPGLVNKKTGRLHTSYNQAVAATGRLSSNNPNLQNIPIRTERGKEIRKAFVPMEGNTLLAADYSQVELRIIASISEDKGMIDAFNNNLDIHASTAAKIFDVEISDVAQEMRRKAKTVNFGIIYGISAFGLSERLNIPRGEASDIIKQYFDKYPGIREYMEKTVNFAKENGYVKTLKGRKRYIRDINSRNHTVRGYAERNAINAPIQGTAADMIKIAMINIHKEFLEKELKAYMILQVHDELVFDAPGNEIEVIKPIITKNMKEAIELKVPVEIDMNTGENWLVAH